MPQSPEFSVDARHLPVTTADLPAFTPSARVVFVAADDVFLHEALGAAVRSMGWRTRQLPSARALLSEPEDGVPSCLVLDVSLPRYGGLQFQERLAVERAETSVVCITGFADVSMTVRAMKAGAIDVLLKPVRPDLLLDAIQHALERSNAVLRESMEARRLRDCYASLSPRERQVMALVASGLLNKQVGGELGISEITVKAHRGRVMRKMNARSLAALVKIVGTLKIAAPCEGH
jgi:FixJ family two-component response regulator